MPRRIQRCIVKSNDLHTCTASGTKEIVANVAYRCYISIFGDVYVNANFGTPGASTICRSTNVDHLIVPLSNGHASVHEFSYFHGKFVRSRDRTMVCEPLNGRSSSAGFWPLWPLTDHHHPRGFATLRLSTSQPRSLSSRARQIFLNIHVVKRRWESFKAIIVRGRIKCDSFCEVVARSTHPLPIFSLSSVPSIVRSMCLDYGTMEHKFVSQISKKTSLLRGG